MTTSEAERTGVAEATGSMRTEERLRRWATAMVAALLTQVLLGVANAAWLHVPEAGDAFAGTTPAWLLLAHVVVGTMIVAGAVVVLVLAIRSHGRAWVTAAVLGVAGVVLAWAAGSTFISNHGAEWASMLMATGCVIAIASYVVALARQGTR
jgi:hypothetical protein